MYWKHVLSEVASKNLSTHDFYFTNIKKIGAKQKAIAIKKTVLKRYYLGKEFDNKHFSKREAECMICLLRGKTIKGVAKSLGLSPRTVEFYLKNMKRKLSCSTKPELIELVLQSDFLKNVDLV